MPTDAPASSTSSASSAARTTALCRLAPARRVAPTCSRSAEHVFTGVESDVAAQSAQNRYIRCCWLNRAAALRNYAVACATFMSAVVTGRIPTYRQLDARQGAIGRAAGQHPHPAVCDVSAQVRVLVAQRVERDDIPVQSLCVLGNDLDGAAGTPRNRCDLAVFRYNACQVERKLRCDRQAVEAAVCQMLRCVSEPMPPEQQDTTVCIIARGRMDEIGHSFLEFVASWAPDAVQYGVDLLCVVSLTETKSFIATQVPQRVLIYHNTLQLLLAVLSKLRWLTLCVYGASTSNGDAAALTLSELQCCCRGGGLESQRRRHHRQLPLRQPGHQLPRAA